MTYFSRESKMTLQYIPELIYDAGPSGFDELILNLLLKMKNLERGQIIEVITYDPSAIADLPAWCRMQNYTLLDHKNFGGSSYYYIERS